MMASRGSFALSLRPALMALVLIAGVAQSQTHAQTQAQTPAQTPAPAQQDPATPPTSAPAAPPATQGDSDASRLVGTPWEFSNAERDKVCQLTFKAERAPQGSRLEFDANCAGLFPIVRDIVAWRFAQNDLLRLVDRAGKTLVEFGEVESGMFEAPTPGVGLLFLQAPGMGGGGPPQRAAEDMFGEWTVTRAGKPVCMISLDSNGSNNRFPVRIRPGCDAAIAQQNFAFWTMERGELLISPSRGAPWRFEEVDAANFRRVPEGANPIAITRQ